MKQILQTPNEHHWPRCNAPTVECRKRDLVIRATNWMRDRNEPAYDVEVYIGGVYDWNESKSFTMFEHQSQAACKAQAIEFASAKIAQLL